MSALTEPDAGAAPPRDLDLELQRRAVHERLFGAALAPVRLGRFSLLRRVGAGGMGVVYAAWDERLDREVALKLLHPQLGGAEATARLLREAKAMARLSHPNVVQLHDVGEHGGRLFVTMELVVGETLRAWVARVPRPWRAIVDMYIRTGEGLAAAHAEGLVHRDFKPENAIVAARDGRPRVLDFGLASLVAGVGLEGARPGAEAGAVAVATGGAGARLTCPDAHVGTPGYAAPEVARGAIATPLADQYSFCVALYEALHGARPDEVARAKDATAGGGPPPWIDAALRRGLDPDPAARWPSMRALLDALAADPSRARRRWLVVAAVALAITGLGVALWGSRAPETVTGGALARAGRRSSSEAEAAAAVADAAARRSEARAEASRLAGLARSRGADDPALGLLLAVEAARATAAVAEPPLVEAEEALRDALDGVRSAPLRADGAPLARVAIAPDGRVRGGRGSRGSGAPVARRRGRGAQARIELSHGRGAVRGLAFFPGGSRLVATLSDGSLAIWAVDREADQAGVIAPALRVEAPLGAAASIAAPQVFVRDGTPRVLVHGGAQAALVVLADGEGPEVLRLGGDARIVALRPSPDGGLVAIGSAGGVRLWRVDDGVALRELRHPARAELRDLDFSPDGATLLSAATDGVARLWRVDGGPPRALPGHGSALRGARFILGGVALVTLAEDQSARLWEIEGRSARPLPEVTLPKLEAAIGLVHDPRGDLLLGTPPGGVALLWSLAELGAPAELRGHAGSVVDAAFTADGEVIATASTDGSVRRWEWGRQADVLRGHTHAVTQVSFVAGGRQVLSAGLDGAARLWTLGAPEHEVAVLAGRSEDAAVIARAWPEGQRIVTVSGDGEVAIWSGDGRRIGELAPVEGEPSDLCVVDGERVAIGTRDGTIEVRRVDGTGAARLDAGAPVTRVRLAEEGARLLAATEGGEVRSWTLVGVDATPGAAFT
ncbi:MAG: protein kinase, partial [Myxococcales bacterium]|nr:protein kinase [Myxococcales bacterium]